MHSIKLFPALLAVGASVVSAASSATATATAASSTCTKDITITEPTPTITCSVVDANIIVDASVAGDLTINGPMQITGDLSVVNATELITISSTTINSIGGNFTLNSLVLLSTVNMPSLQTLNGVLWQKLPQLSTLNFAAKGISKAQSVTITDTFISDLSPLALETVDTLEITSNSKLTTFNSNLQNITTLFTATNNGNNMQINMTQLQTASELHISNVKSFEVPSLQKLSGSIKFDTNPELVSFQANNLTTVTQSVTFINNAKLTNISFADLTSCGDLTIQNNTALTTVDGFPELQTVYGAMLLLGNFTDVEFPSLKDVKGGASVSSTNDISSVCTWFDNAKSNGDIQGSETCTYNNQNANSGATGGTSSTGSASKSDSAAGTLGVNVAGLGLAVLAAITQLL